ncbi:MAG: hypothetical protein RDU24_15010 [Humidesulfovibrio sp.]|nr:hypothetical protein [Humidesulfovibrio sp.]
MALATSLVALRLHTGYPAEWDKVQVGMTISQVRAICGPSTYSGEGVEQERWEKPSLWGCWVLQVGHSEESQGAHALVSTIELYFNASPFGVVPHHDFIPPVKDYDAFYKAFGQVLKPYPYVLPQRSQSTVRLPREP